MIDSLFLIIFLGILLGYLFNIIKIPRIIGMIIAGIIIGPNFFNLISKNILNISEDIRKIALIILLLKVGFSLKFEDLKKVGKSSILLAFIPASLEILAYTIFAPLFFNISRLDSALMGTVLSAVSPAIIVPRMVDIMEKKIGNKNKIPQMILASASLDDIFVIVLFTTFLKIALFGNFSIYSLINIPVSIILGLIIGTFIGYLLYLIFQNSFNINKYIRNSNKIIIILIAAFFMVTLEKKLENTISISSLIGIITMAFIINFKITDIVSKRLSQKLSKLWLIFEILLFVLVGMNINIAYTLKTGFISIILISICLIFRSLGVFISILGNNFNKKEKLFCIISYLPKATVQAAIASIPLSLGLNSGEIILSVAVISILFSAPIGAIGIDYSYKKLLGE